MAPVATAAAVPGSAPTVYCMLHDGAGIAAANTFQARDAAPAQNAQQQHWLQRGAQITQLQLQLWYGTCGGSTEHAGPAPALARAHGGTGTEHKAHRLRPGAEELELRW